MMEPQPPERPSTSRGRRRTDVFYSVESESGNSRDPPRTPVTPLARYSTQSSAVKQSDLELSASRFSHVLTLDAQRQTNSRLGHYATDDTQHRTTSRCSSSSSDHSSAFSPHYPSPTAQLIRQHSSLLEGDLPDTRRLPSRPGSTRYKVLPAITNVGNQHLEMKSTSPNMSSEHLPNRPQGTKHHQSTSAHVNDKTLSNVDSMPVSFSRSAPDKNTRKSLPTDKPTVGVKLQKEQQSVDPPAGQEHLVIAVKLPSGERLQRNFRPTDRLQLVLKFVESEAKINFKGCEFVRADTREVLSDLRATIEASGILDKSVLFLQLPEAR